MLAPTYFAMLVSMCFCAAPAPPAEREREAFALVKSNGGRWKHGNEMGCALKVMLPAAV